MFVFHPDHDDRRFLAFKLQKHTVQKTEEDFVTMSVYKYTYNSFLFFSLDGRQLKISSKHHEFVQSQHRL